MTVAPAPPGRTPYEIVFEDMAFDAEHVPAIRADLETRPDAALSPGAFVMLGSVGRLLRALRPPSEEDATAAPDAVLHYGALAFQAYHFHAAGRRLFTIDDELLDTLLAQPALGSWSFAAPAAAGYLQLPRNRVWAPGAMDSPPESVDGFHWTVLAGSDRPPTRLDIVLCTGLRPGRPGLGAIDIAVPLPVPSPGHWGDVQARDEGRDFANVLPGGELDRLLALTTAAEVLKLASRTFWYVNTRPGAVGELQSSRPGTPPASAHAMPPSALDWVPLGISPD